MLFCWILQMKTDLYKRMQKTSNRILGKYDQGPFTYYKPGATSGPAYDPVYEPETEHVAEGTVSGVEMKYIKDGYISGSDFQVRLSLFDVSPTVEGEIFINGKRRQIIEVRQIPGAGIVDVWLLFVKS